MAGGTSPAMLFDLPSREKAPRAFWGYVGLGMPVLFWRGAFLFVDQHLQNRASPALLKSPAPVSHAPLHRICPLPPLPPLLPDLMLRTS